jgi:hypothetical protein
MGFNIASALRATRRAAPMLFLYLVLSQEALAVHANIRLTAAFQQAPRLTRQTTVQRRAQRPMWLTMSGAGPCKDLCPSKVLAAGVTGFSLLSSVAQIANAADEMVAPKQVRQIIVAL